MYIGNFKHFYQVIGARVHGKVKPYGIFMWYWYGLRVDAMYTEMNYRGVRKLGSTRDLSYGRALWPYLPQEWKNEYARQAKNNNGTAWWRFMKAYLGGRKAWSDKICTWSNGDTDPAAPRYSSWSDPLFAWADEFTGWGGLYSYEDTGWTMPHFSFWSDELYQWSMPFIGWSKL